jgi:hypothetical protein
MQMSFVEGRIKNRFMSSDKSVVVMEIKKRFYLMHLKSGRWQKTGDRKPLSKFF